MPYMDPMGMLLEDVVIEGTDAHAYNAEGISPPPPSEVV